MNPILNLLSSRIDSGMIQQIASRLNTDPQTAAKATEASLPVLLSGLASNASRAGGADTLLGALRKDHDGSVLDGTDALDAHPQAGKGGGILDHVLGNKQNAVAQGVSRASGLDASKVIPLLAMLAPLVMGALGRARNQQGVDSAGGLSGLLTGALGSLTGGAGVAGTGGLGGLLDSDHDGQIADDVARLGSSVLGGGGAKGGSGMGAMLGGLFGGQQR